MFWTFLCVGVLFSWVCSAIEQEEVRRVRERSRQRSEIAERLNAERHKERMARIGMGTRPVRPRVTKAELLARIED